MIVELKIGSDRLGLTLKMPIKVGDFLTQNPYVVYGGNGEN